MRLVVPLMQVVKEEMPLMLAQALLGRRLVNPHFTLSVMEEKAGDQSESQLVLKPMTEALVLHSCGRPSRRLSCPCPCTRSWSGRRLR